MWPGIMEIGNAEEMCVVPYSAITCYWTDAPLADYLYDVNVAMSAREKRYVASGWC